MCTCASVVRFIAVSACASEAAVMLPNAAAPVAATPVRKLRRDGSAATAGEAGVAWVGGCAGVRSDMMLPVRCE